MKSSSDVDRQQGTKGDIQTEYDDDPGGEEAPEQRRVDHRTGKERDQHHVQGGHVARRTDRDEDEQEDGYHRRGEIGHAGPRVPLAEPLIAGGMLSAVARMKANMKTLRPLRLLSDSPGVSPIERMPSSERSHSARARIVGTY